ncbi:MAG: serine/threonine protein kinase [Woeseiaceae bacterium]
MNRNNTSLAYAELQPQDFLDALEKLGFQCNGRLLALNSYENRVYQIGIDEDDAVVAKFYRPNRWSNAAILEEHEFAAELESQEIPVVAPLEIAGETLHKVAGFRVAVYPNRGGRAPDLDNYELLKQLGRFVARIHLVGEIADFEHRPNIDVDSYALESRDFLLEQQFIPGELRPAYESIAELVIDRIVACFARAGSIDQIRLHGDFHPGNVLVLGEKLHIVDFDDTRTGPAVQDLWMFLSGDRAEQVPQIAALLEGYQSFRRFDARELHVVEALRSLRIMHYAAWLARRWDDPAFKQAFPWFDSHRYWEDHVLALREQVALMQEEPLEWLDY